MNVSFTRSNGDEQAIAIPAIGLTLLVRLPGAAAEDAFSIIETVNAPGKGPPRHRHPQAEIFRVIEGRYLYEVNGNRFYAEAGDVVSIPGNTEHAFVNVTDMPARQYILIAPALDAEAFFTGLAGLMADGMPDVEALDNFGLKWQVKFLGPPLKPSDQPSLDFRQD